MGDNVEIPLTGYVTGANLDMQLDVPFFVNSEQLPHPVIGFNVVKVIAGNHPE